MLLLLMVLPVKNHLASVANARCMRRECLKGINRTYSMSMIRHSLVHVSAVRPDSHCRRHHSTQTPQNATILLDCTK